MVDIITCKKCGKDGIPREFTSFRYKKSRFLGICKDCKYTQGMNDREKELYFIAKERKFRKKISTLYEEDRPKYSMFAHKLTVDDCPVRLPKDILWVKCAYCGKHFIPKINQVRNRIRVLDNLNSGESRFYCSMGCRSACPIFNKKLYPAGFKEASSREVQAELRQMRLAIDNYECQRCGKNIKKIELHCHHLTGIRINPIESADIDNTITLCKKCHKWAHTLDGCGYSDLQCKNK